MTEEDQTASKDEDADSGVIDDTVHSARGDLGKLSLDPLLAIDPDPESWDEQPTGDDADHYLSQRPPHHGD